MMMMGPIGEQAATLVGRGKSYMLDDHNLSWSRHNLDRLHRSGLVLRPQRRLTLLGHHLCLGSGCHGSDQGYNGRIAKEIGVPMHHIKDRL
jgi:hypothetical protein